MPELIRWPNQATSGAVSPTFSSFTGQPLQLASVASTSPTLIYPASVPTLYASQSPTYLHSTQELLYTQPAVPVSSYVVHAPVVQTAPVVHQVEKVVFQQPPPPQVVEKIVSVPVEKFVDRIVEVPMPVEKIVEKIVHKDREVPVEKIVHVPVEKIVYVEREPVIVRKVGLGLLLERGYEVGKGVRASDNERNAPVVIVEIVPGFAGDRSGRLRTNDVVEAIDGRWLQGLEFDTVKSLCVADEGSECQLQVRRGDYRFAVTLKRVDPSISSGNQHAYHRISPEAGALTYKQGSSANSSQRNSNATTASAGYEPYAKYQDLPAGATIARPNPAGAPAAVPVAGGYYAPMPQAAGMTTQPAMRRETPAAAPIGQFRMYGMPQDSMRV